MAIVAQLSHGEIAVKAAGTGMAQMKPMTVRTIGGTQMMCNSSLRGLLWLSPYSPNHCSTVRMASDATPASWPLQECARARQGRRHAADAAIDEVGGRQRR